MWSNSPLKEKQPPQRRDFPWAAASAISDKWIIYSRLIVLTGLVLLGAALLMSSTLRGCFSGVIMLFTQKSVHTLAGALRAAEALGAGLAVLLATVHAAILPWLPRLLPLANGMVFGPVVGFILSLTGAMAGGGVCFGMTRLLLRPMVVRLQPPQVRRRMEHGGGAVVCAALLFFPGATGFTGYLAGMSGLPFRRYLLGAVVGETATLLVHALCCSPYTTQLPQQAQLGLSLAGASVLALGAAKRLRTLKKRGTI